MQHDLCAKAVYINIQGVGGEEDGFSFLFQKVRYVYCREQKQFSAVKFPTGLDKKDYLNTRGLNGDVEIEEARKTFGKNRYAFKKLNFFHDFSSPIKFGSELTRILGIVQGESYCSVLCVSSVLCWTMVSR